MAYLSFEYTRYGIIPVLPMLGEEVVDQGTSSCSVWHLNIDSLRESKSLANYL